MSESLIFLTAPIVRFGGSVTATVSPLLRWTTSMSPFSETMSPRMRVTLAAGAWASAAVLANAMATMVLPIVER